MRRAVAKSNATKVRAWVRTSICHRLGHISSLPQALPNFFDPGTRIRTVNHAAQESEPLGCIVSVPADVIFRGTMVYQARKRSMVRGFAKM